MSEETTLVTTLVLQAVIGILVAVVVAILTSWFNRRYFREQLGEQRYVEVYLDKMLDLWGEVVDIYGEITQLFALIDSERHRMLNQGASQEKVLRELKGIYQEKMPPILVRTSFLCKYYFLLPQETIDILRKFQGTILIKCKDIDYNEFVEITEELSSLSNNVFEQVREDLSNLAARRTTVAAILTSTVDITPPHISEILSKSREDRSGAEGRTGEHL